MKLSVISLIRHTGQHIQKPGHSIMVSRLSWVTGEDQVTDYFTKYGKVTHVHLPLDLKQGIHRGYGFVHFANKNSAIEAAEDLSRQKLDNTVIHVKLADDRKDVNFRHKKH